MNPLRHLRNRKVLAVIAFVALLLVMALWPATVPVDLAPVETGTLLSGRDVWLMARAQPGPHRMRNRRVSSAAANNSWAQA